MTKFIVKPSLQKLNPRPAKLIILDSDRCEKSNTRLPEDCNYRNEFLASKNNISQNRRKTDDDYR